MSPHSLLHTPVALLRDAPPDAVHSSHGERRERRMALAAVIGMVALVALGSVLGSHHPAAQRCADAPATPPTDACPAR